MFTACQLQEQMLDTHSQMVDVAWEAVKELGLPARSVFLPLSVFLSGHVIGVGGML